MADMIEAKSLRSGQTIFGPNKEILLVLENTFNKTAMRQGIVKTKVKNLRTGAIVWIEFTGDKLEQVIIDKKKMTFLYKDGANYVFMDQQDYSQIEIPEKQLEWEKNFITEDSEVTIISYQSEILGVNLPELVPIEVEFAEEAVQGNTANMARKRARLVSGYELDVPQFIRTGDKIVISTIDGSYRERYNK
ncbi:elongation factor P [Mycoplasmoides pneumoniae]|uniref:Elongation factor P n=4 Tax=Mycoplasmoides pneumoniae TaxID=2104 RepID=EFP_MYCPN|nr:elongation factor P [Mycoplasmoides pneumoniae]P75085.1 RecName: Full=Elongation factor P; Short=EF-P [Mycoplasmoides pneumoniae M129]AAB95773.1 elongation factor P [Mycoplasmoides pneumoniae M129]ADK87021.1 translation elongation factor P [Mycoplasmoides pneumoniae FH]AGC03973.1 elongation factor P [Mycoplasmoides pneumoniae M129-B7]ALA29905.1 elongation factor P [Mycoplasmoides pneumoniae PI 1428]ALA30876.1 elongation factor P [Mycoplasmoides pneumoniae 19294]